MNADVLIFTPILSLSVRATPFARAAGVRRAIYFSSNNVAVDPLANIYRDLRAAESHVRSDDGVILRPTLIYGDPALSAMSRLCVVMRGMPVFPAPGIGRHQPIFFRDLALIATELAERRAGGIFAIGGPDTLSTNALLREVSRALGGARLIVPAPSSLIAGLAGVARMFTSELPLSQDQIARLDRDRSAVVEDPLPPGLRPATSVSAGLRELIGALRARGWKFGPSGQDGA